MPFILASSSQRRQQLLKYLITDFEVITADIDEEQLGKLARTPQEMVVGLAKAKAKKVWDIVRANVKFVPTEQIVILGADTTVVIANGDNWQSIGKPKDEVDAKKIIQSLRGRQHQVYTGICLIVCRGQACLPPTMAMVNIAPTIIIDYDISTVTFGDFSDSVIDDYIATGTVMDKAGAYAIQDIGKDFKISVEGSFSNVVGLPIERLVKHFEKIGIEYNQNWQDKISNKKYSNLGW